MIPPINLAEARRLHAERQAFQRSLQEIYNDALAAAQARQTMASIRPRRSVRYLPSPQRAALVWDDVQ